MLLQKTFKISKKKTDPGQTIEAKDNKGLLSL